MLLIEDTRAGTTTTTRMLAPFGEVRAARSVDDAKAIMATGFQPDVIVTDLNLGDHRRWQDTVTDVVEISAGRPIAAQTAQVWPDLLEEFARLFSGEQAQLFSKRDERSMLEWLRQLHDDQSGRFVPMMGHGSRQSKADMRAELRSYLEELGVPKPADDWLRTLVRCIVRWETRRDAAGEIAWRTLVALTVAGLAGWIGWAAVQWLRVTVQ